MGLLVDRTIKKSIHGVELYDLEVECGGNCHNCWNSEYLVGVIDHMFELARQGENGRREDSWRRRWYM